MLNKVNKFIGLQQKLQIILPKLYVLTIYKLFNRIHFDYSDIIYDQEYNASIQQIIESIECNVSVAITETIRGIYKNKIFEDLGLQSIQHRHWYRKLCCFCKPLK